MNEQLSITEVLSSFPPEVWCGAIAGVATFVIEMVLVAKGKIFSGRNKRLEKAREAGRYVRGKRVRCHYREKSSSNKTCDRRYVAQYEYTLNGKTKTKQVASTGTEPGYTIWIYYDEKGRVFTDGPTAKDLLMIVLYIIPVLVAVLVLHVLGYEP